MKKYDCIVVGGGNAGLMCAVYTAQAGLKTLLLEKNNVPGGSATSFVRGRFEFEPSLHELAGLTNDDKDEIVNDIFKEIDFHPHVCNDDLLYRGIYKEDNFEFCLYAGKERIINDIERYVPASKESVEALFNIIEEIKETFSGTEGASLNVLMKHPNFLRMAAITTRQAMNNLGIPEKAQRILEVYWSYLGVPLDEMNALHYFTMCGYYYRGGASIPLKRSHELSLGLAEKILEAGGEIYYNSPVDEFLMDSTNKNQCIGVRVKDTCYYADYIVAAIAPANVYNRMKHVPLRNLKVHHAISYGISIFTIYCGLDISYKELGLKDYSNFVMKHNDPYKQLKYQLESPELYILNCLDILAPTKESDHSSILYFSIPCEVASFPKHLKPEEYKAYKNKIAEMYIKDAEETFNIDIKNHIEEISIATPATFARYLSTPGGSIYGYRLSAWDNMMTRIMAKGDNEIQHLIFCGGSIRQGVGHSSTYANGKDTALMVINALKGGADHE